MLALEPGDPRVVGRYRLLARLGVGGMAIVYFGRSPGRRAVAVKVMHAELAAEPTYRERFRNEVTATAAVAGPYCPAVVDADPAADVPWLVTEFLPAVSLRDAVRDHGPLPVEAAWPLAAGLAEALAAVHRAGVVHRDVTPANVLLTADGPRIIDFGIAVVDPDGLRPGGTAAGSWGFMAPEQAGGGPVAAAGDVYSFGVTMTFACTGSRDAAGLDRLADARLRDLIAGCLRTDPGRRPTVAALLGEMTAGSGAGWLPAGVRADLDRRAGEARNPPEALGGTVSRPPVRRRTLLIAGLTATAGAAGAAAWVFRPDRPRVDRPGTATPATSTVTSAATSVPAKTRTLEIYAYGRTTVRTLTSVLNGQAETVPAAPLPYRRTVQVPPEPAPVTWRFAYRCTAGVFTWVVTLDGQPVGGYGEASTSGDIEGDRNDAT